MAERTWFFASKGQQQGPYGETQFREFIAQGSIGPDTLVWSEGMSGWQKAGDIPGLMTGGARPPAMPQSGPPAMAASADYDGALSIDFRIWDFVWRSLAFFLGLLVVIPTPWVVPWYVNWFVSRIHVPGRPNLSFTGRPGTIALWYFGTLVVLIFLGSVGSVANMKAISNLGSIVQLVLYWLFLKWLFTQLASNGQPLGLNFSGSFWAFTGYTILAVLAFITIIGWAWVYVAQIRWFCRNIQGTRRQIIFKGTGLEFLWRAVVAGLVSTLVIPAPWMYRWMARWMASQTVLVERA